MEALHHLNNPNIFIYILYTVNALTSIKSANLIDLADKIFLTDLLLNFNAADKTKRTKFLSAFINIALAPLSNVVPLICAASSLVLQASCYFLLLNFYF
jgi:hypothetical protein